MRPFYRPAPKRSLALCVAPLALGLAIAGCGSDASGDGAQSSTGEPVAAVAAPQGGDWNQQVTRTEAGGWLVGNPSAPIRLIEYGSLTCPACAAFSVQGSQQLHEDYIASGRVNYEFRSVLIHGVVDLLLTRMLECAAPQSALPLAHQLWGDLDTVTGRFQDNSAALEQAQTLPEDQRFVAMAQAGGLVDYFAARGISTSQAQQCLSDPAAMQRLAGVTQETASLNDVNSTPTFFLNGARLESSGWAEVEAAMQNAGAR